MSRLHQDDEIVRIWRTLPQLSEEEAAELDKLALELGLNVLNTVEGVPYLSWPRAENDKTRRTQEKLCDILIEWGDLFPESEAWRGVHPLEVHHAPDQSFMLWLKEASYLSERIYWTEQHQEWLKKSFQELMTTLRLERDSFVESSPRIETALRFFTEQVEQAGEHFLSVLDEARRVFMAWIAAACWHPSSEKLFGLPIFGESLELELGSCWRLLRRGPTSESVLMCLARSHLRSNPMKTPLLQVQIWGLREVATRLQSIADAAVSFEERRIAATIMMGIVHTGSVQAWAEANQVDENGLSTPPSVRSLNEVPTPTDNTLERTVICARIIRSSEEGLIPAIRTMNDLEGLLRSAWKFISVEGKEITSVLDPVKSYAGHTGMGKGRGEVKALMRRTTEKAEDAKRNLGTSVTDNLDFMYGRWLVLERGVEKDRAERHVGVILGTLQPPMQKG